MDKSCDFQNFKTLRSFGREIHNNDLSLDDALEQQIKVKYDSGILEKFTKPKELVKKEKSTNTKKYNYIS